MDVSVLVEEGIKTLPLLLPIMSFQYILHRNRGMSKETKERFGEFKSIKTDIASIKTSLKYIEKEIYNGKNKERL